jgi:hypothetical protein
VDQARNDLANGVPGGAPALQAGERRGRRDPRLASGISVAGRATTGANDGPDFYSGAGVRLGPVACGL